MRIEERGCSMVKMYIEKPIVAAIRYTKESYSDCVDFCNERFVACLDDCLIIETFERQQFVRLGDYIVKSVKGDIYPCAPDIFEMTYEEVKRV